MSLSLAQLLAKKKAEGLENGAASQEMAQPPIQSIHEPVSEIKKTENTVSKPVISFNFGKSLSQVASSQAQTTDKTNVESKPTIEAGPSLKDFNHSDMGNKFTGNEEQSFREALGILHSNFDNMDMVANATRNILLSLRQHSEFVAILQPEDCQLMVRALRQGHGLVASSKINNKNKRSANAALVDDLANEIFGSDFSVG